MRNSEWDFRYFLGFVLNIRILSLNIVPYLFFRMEVNPFSRPRDFDALKSERARLESFSQPPGWPIPFIRPEECAHAGFFFLQDGDKVNYYAMLGILMLQLIKVCSCVFIYISIYFLFPGPVRILPWSSWRMGARG